MGRFAAELARLRRESGFPTPYAFYHRNGGRHAFPFTFAYYLKVERGDSLPRAAWVPSLLSLLRIPPTRDLHRRFALAYMEDLLGRAAYDALLGPYLTQAAAAPAAEQAAKRLLSEQAIHLTPRQVSALAASADAYWCFECLVNEREGLDEARLAEATGLGPARVAKGLAVLAAQRLARRGGRRRWRSHLAGRFYVFPRAYPGLERDRLRFRAAQDAMARARGEDLFTGAIVLRAEDAAMRRTAQDLAAAIEAASPWSTSSSGERTGLYKVEARARRLMAF